MKTVRLGWMNYDKEKNDFVTIRESTGEGIRTVAFPITANGNHILSTCKELFFPKDISNKLTKARFYITTKKLLPSQLIKSMNSTVNVRDSDEDSDGSFLDFIYSDRTIRCKPCAEVGTVHQSPRNDLPQNNLAELSPITPELSISQIIGSSTELTKLLSEIDQAYQEPLKVDQLKSNYEKEQGQSKPSSTIPNFNISSGRPESSQSQKFIERALWHHRKII